MENFALISLVEAFKQSSEGLVVRKVIQHHSTGFMFQTRSVHMRAFKIWLDSHNPALYISDFRHPVSFPPTDFLMALRKYLTDAKLKKIEKPLSERIVELEFKTKLPAKELETVILVIELLPNSPNMVLLDSERRVLVSFSSAKSQRRITHFDEYQYPQLSGKSDLTEACKDGDWFNEKEYEEKGKNWLIQNIAGIGPLFAAEIARCKGRLHDEIKSFLERVQSHSTKGWIYSSRPLSAIIEQNDLALLRKAKLSPIELVSLGRGHSYTTFPGILEAAKTLYDELESKTLLSQAKKPKLRSVHNRLKKLRLRQNRLLLQLKQFERSLEEQDTATLLLSSGEPMDKHHKKVQVRYYVDNEPHSRNVELDSSLTLRANINKMFKKYQKAKRGRAVVERQIQETETLELAVKQEGELINSIKNWDRWLATNQPRNKQDRPAVEKLGIETKTRLKRTSVQINGREVLFGRNGKENDELTFKFAARDDFWLHVAGYSGSHVIVRNPSKAEELERPVLLRAAQLAAYHSQARNSRKVDVHYTHRRFVSKPRKAKPGLVHLREFKTITVEPKNWSDQETTIKTDLKGSKLN